MKERDIGIEEMLSDRFENIHEKAFRRIDEAIDGVPVVAEYKKSREESESELLAYPAARFMVASIGDANLVKWFSHHEGARAYEYMKKEGNEVVLALGEELELSTMPPPAGAARSGKDTTPVRYRVRSPGERPPPSQNSFWLRFPEYLQARRNISGVPWDLVNKRLVSGLVEVEREHYIRLLQEKVRGRVEDGLYNKVAVPKDSPVWVLVQRLMQKVEGRRKRYSPTDLGKLTITRMPPCMRQIIGMSQVGENMPHHARFALVTFLNAAGLSREDIFKVFTTAPDFKEEIVRYQIDHITGASSSTSYSVPNCDTMKTGGICYDPDSLCGMEWMTNPFIYFKVKGRKRGVTSEENAS